MKILLDTHIFLWWITDSPRLSITSREIIVEDANEIYVSAASAWEIAIKTGLGKINLPKDPEAFLTEQIVINSFQILPVHFLHALRVIRLPKHHRDPFDRLLVAQAQVEDMPLMSADPVFKKYEVTIVN